MPFVILATPISSNIIEALPQFSGFRCFETTPFAFFSIVMQRLQPLRDKSRRHAARAFLFRNISFVFVVYCLSRCSRCRSCPEVFPASRPPWHAHRSSRASPEGISHRTGIQFSKYRFPGWKGQKRRFVRRPSEKALYLFPHKTAKS